MLAKTCGIVLHHFKYGDSGIIAQMYTEGFGRQSFIIKGARGKKNRTGIGFFQPLFVLNLEFYYKENKELHLVKEISSAKIFNHFPFDANKRVQVMFIAEILYKCLREEEKNEPLFNFLLNSIEYFDLCEEGSSNFHLTFLLKLTSFLGIAPETIRAGDQSFFDIKEGIFDSNIPLHFNFLDKAMASLMLKFLNSNYQEASNILLNHVERNSLLREILRFYTFHHYPLGDLKSLSVLSDIYR